MLNYDKCKAREKGSAPNTSPESVSVFPGPWTNKCHQAHPHFFKIIFVVVESNDKHQQTFPVVL